MNDVSSEVLIVGAGPAGSTAAILLARNDVPVQIIEQHRFPRDKVCGECLSSVGIGVLQRLGVLQEVMMLGATKLRRAIVHAPNGASLELSLPRPMLGISRRALDALLLDRARDAGASLLQPARAVLPSPQGRGWGRGERSQVQKFSPPPAPPLRGGEMLVRDLASNEVRRIQSSSIIVADGKARTKPRDFGIKAHFTDVDGPRDAIELFGVDGHYGGIAPVENGMWNISFAAPTARIRATRGDLDEMFSHIVGENRALRHRMRRARRCSEWLSAPLPRFPVARRWATNLIPIGNAAAAVEPIGGEGIGLALRSAEIAANAVIDARRASREVDVSALRREYRKLWRTRRFACRAAALLISRPSIANALLRAFDGRDLLPRLALRLTGKATCPT